jgi:hypothetical protein
MKEAARAPSIVEQHSIYAIAFDIDKDAMRLEAHRILVEEGFSTLNGFLFDEIERLGRWKSSPYERYIRFEIRDDSPAAQLGI